MNSMSSVIEAAPDEPMYRMLIGGQLQGSSQWLEVVNSCDRKVVHLGRPKQRRHNWIKRFARPKTPS